MSALWLCAFADRSARLAGALEVSWFSCMLFLDVPASSTTPRPASARDSVASTDIAFPLSKQGRHAVRQLSGLNSPAHRYLYLRFAVRLATHHARLEVRIESLLLFRRALSSPTTCRFIPAHLLLRLSLSTSDDTVLRRIRQARLGNTSRPSSKRLMIWPGRNSRTTARSWSTWTYTAAPSVGARKTAV